MNEVSDAAERHAEAEVKAVLKGLLRNLTEVRAQRIESRGLAGGPGQWSRIQGEIDGLNIAIAAVKRRIR